MTDFKAFLLRGNLIDMAVGIVIGIAFAAVITALVADLVTPLIAAIGGQSDFSGLSFTIHKSHFLYGAFINALVSFIVIAAVLFLPCDQAGECPHGEEKDRTAGRRNDKALSTVLERDPRRSTQVRVLHC